MKVSITFALVLTLAAAQDGRAQLRSTNFGTSVLVHSGEILVGEPNNSYRPGTVYVYAKDDDNHWTERARLTASDAAFYDGFGASMAVSGNRLVVGALRQNDGTGAAYVFERQDGNWVQTARLTVPDAASEDKLGTAVGIRGDVVAVGAPATTRYGSLTPSKKPGSAFIFQRDSDDGSWSYSGRLEGSAAHIGAAFGRSVAVSDLAIFVGAPQQDGRSGAVYAFERLDDQWTEVQAITSSLLSDQSAFASALATDGEILYVGAPGHAGGQGAVSVLRPAESEDGTASRLWAEDKRFLPFDGPQTAYFGASIAADGEALWSGAPLLGDARGDVYRIDLSGDTSEARVDPEEIEVGTYFGYAVAADGEVAAAAVPEGDGLEGVVTALEKLSDGTWSVSAILRGDESGLEPITGTRTRCQDGKAALFNCERVDLLSFLPVKSLGGKRGTRVNDLWGWTDPESGREYVLVGRTDGTAFVDMSDPENPIYLGDLPLTDGAQPTVWRDVKVYKDHAFIVADGTRNHGMQVFDLRQLRDVEAIPARFTETALYDGLENAHNIAINEESGFAYTVGGDKCGGGLHMVDIRDPKNPTFAGCFTHHEAGSGSTHDTQCVIYRGPDSEYAGREVCFSSNGSAFSIADVTDKNQPVGISSASFPNHAYIHQGWLTEDQRYFFMNDELDEFVGNVDQTRTLIWDVTDLDDPQLVHEYFFGSTSADHNLYIDGSYMYQSNYLSGLHVHDVSDPERPRQIAHFDTVPVGENSSRLDGSWSNYPFFESGVVPVSSKEEGLFLLKVADEAGL